MMPGFQEPGKRISMNRAMPVVARIPQLRAMASASESIRRELNELLHQAFRWFDHQRGFFREMRNTYQAAA
jgi:hypothetical protein